MNHIYRIFLLILSLSALSCEERKQPLHPESPTQAIPSQVVDEFSEPIVLFVYPDSKYADSLKKAWGNEKYYQRQEQEVSYFHALRNKLKNSGINIVTSEKNRFRFIQSNGAIVETDISQIASPWQILLFNGNESPVLASPGHALYELGKVFPDVTPAQESTLRNKKLRTSRLQADREEEKTIIQSHPIHHVDQGSREITIRLMIPPGEDAPTGRDETSGIRIINSFISPSRRFWLIFDNDIFSNTDRYYTNGVSIGITAPRFVGLPLNFLMISPRRNNVVHASISMHHAIFTPFTTKTPPLLQNDRPYASTLFVRYSQTSEDALSGISISSSIDAGVIGDAALGRYFQQNVHSGIPTNDEPLGWETQIKNDLILNYALQLQKQLYKTDRTEVYAHGSAEAGTLRTRLIMGMEAATGNLAPGLTPLPYSYDELVQHPQIWQLGIKGGVDFSLIGYDATLEGGCFNKNKKSTFALKPDEIERMVAHLHLGIFARYKKVGLNISQHYLSPEFKEGKQHFWGQIGIEYGW